MPPLRLAPVPFGNLLLWQEALVRRTAGQRVLTFFVSRVTPMGGDDRWRGLKRVLSTGVNSLAWKLLYVTQRIVR
jgi:hypothetical protein